MTYKHMENEWLILEYHRPRRRWYLFDKNIMAENTADTFSRNVSGPLRGRQPSNARRPDHPGCWSNVSLSVPIMIFPESSVRYTTCGAYNDLVRNTGLTGHRRI